MIIPTGYGVQGLSGVDWGDIIGTATSQSITTGMDILHDQFGNIHPQPGQYFMSGPNGTQIYAVPNGGANANFSLSPNGIGNNWLLIGGIALLVMMVAMRGR